MINVINVESLEKSFDLLKSLQKIINNIFNLELTEGDNDELQTCFKVLVFDDYVYEIINPLLKVF